MNILNLAKSLKEDLSLKMKDITQLSAEATKLERKINKLKSTALYGNIILKDGKYFVFVSRMINGKRTRKQLGVDSVLKAEYEQRISQSIELDEAQSRLQDIENELFEFDRRISNRRF